MGCLWFWVMLRQGQAPLVMLCVAHSSAAPLPTLTWPTRCSIIHPRIFSQIIMVTRPSAYEARGRHMLLASGWWRGTE
jgi:hypothetical protein